MLKYLLTATVLLIAIPTIAQKKGEVKAVFPKEMAEPLQKQYFEFWEKGRIVYSLTCANCHNVVVKKKELIPDFTPEQIKGYEIRVLNPQHESSMPDEKVTEEELMFIATFLQYKNKSGVAMEASKKH